MPDLTAHNAARDALLLTVALHGCLTPAIGTALNAFLEVDAALIAELEAAREVVAAADRHAVGEFAGSHALITAALARYHALAQNSQHPSPDEAVSMPPSTEAAAAWERYALLRIDNENPYAGCEDLATITNYFAALAPQPTGDSDE